MRLLSPQLQAFLAVVKHKTVHGAAASLHLTQTAVTQRIRALENQLSTSLFVRSRRGMLLTKEAEALLRYCLDAQELEGEALASISNTGKDSSVSLCMTGPYTIMQSRIIPRCIQVLKQYPRLLMQFDINDHDDRAHALRRADCQLAVLEKYMLYDEMEYKDLQPEEYILVVCAKWKKRSLRDVVQNERIIDFNPHDQMTFNYLKHFDLSEYANRDRYFVNRTDILAFMISNGLGYGVLPLEFAKPYLAKKQLAALNSGKTYHHPLVLAWFPRHQQPEYFSALIGACE